jgi:hypothetical protein
MTKNSLLRFPRWSIVSVLTTIGVAVSVKRVLADSQFAPMDGRNLGGPSLMTVVLMGLLSTCICFIWGCVLERTLNSVFSKSDDTMGNPGVEQSAST